ncbi:MAG: thioesterase [Treponema sp.]|jgi:acyl-ACP thioesterase|nr:thioesterase [Treponema sp.]
MLTFVEQHDEHKQIFSRQMVIDFSQCNEKRELYLFELLRISSDTATEDYKERGMSAEFLQDHGYAMLVSRQAFRFHRMPRENDFVTLETWEETPEPIQLVRGYRFIDKNGAPLISGISSWIIVDPKSRRIVRPSEFTLREPPVFHRELDCMKFGKISIPKDLQKLSERHICFSDIDANGHMNNARYGAYAIDSLPVEYQQKKFSDFRINFSKEARRGDLMEMFGSFNDEQKKAVIVGRHDGITSFECEFYWK